MGSKLLHLLVAGVALCSAQSLKDSRVNAQIGVTPIATVSSSNRVIVNGIEAPAGVSSVIVAPGDILTTMSASATVRFQDGRTVTLAPGTEYRFPSRSTGMPARTGRQVDVKPLKVTPPNVSTVKP